LFEIEVFSDPARAVANVDGVLRREHFAATAKYDEDLVKPALLLADKTSLRSRRIDFALNEARNVDTTQKLVPLTSMLVGESKRRDGRFLASLGLSDSDLLTDEEISSVEAQILIQDELHALRQSRVRSTNLTKFRADKERDRAEIAKSNQYWDDFWDRAAPFRDALRRHYKEQELSFRSAGIARLAESGLVNESPWDSTPRSRPREVLDHLSGPNTEFDRAFASMAEDVANSRKSVMLDGQVRSSLLTTATATGDLASTAVIGGAVDLMRMVKGLSELPIDQIADVRAELVEYLAPFRDFMLQVSHNTSVGAVTDAERERLLRLAWEREVESAIAEMRAHVQRSTFTRNVIDVFATTSGTLGTVGLAIGTVTAAGFAGFSTLTAVGAVGAPLLKALVDSIRTKQEVKQNRAYFIHEFARLSGR